MVRLLARPALPVKTVVSKAAKTVRVGRAESLAHRPATHQLAERRQMTRHRITNVSYRPLPHANSKKNNVGLNVTREPASRIGSVRHECLRQFAAEELETFGSAGEDEFLC